MRAAFHRVCDVLLLDCAELVTKIVALAKAGEFDSECNDVAN
jgi:hypothetical protein